MIAALWADTQVITVRAQNLTLVIVSLRSKMKIETQYCFLDSLVRCNPIISPGVVAIIRAAKLSISPSTLSSPTIHTPLSIISVNRLKSLSNLCDRHSLLYGWKLPCWKSFSCSGSSPSAVGDLQGETTDKSAQVNNSSPWPTAKPLVRIKYCEPHLKQWWTRLNPFHIILYYAMRRYILRLNSLSVSLTVLVL